MNDKGLLATNEIREAPKNSNSHLCEFVFFGASLISLVAGKSILFIYRVSKNQSSHFLKLNAHTLSRHSILIFLSDPSPIIGYACH